MSGEAPAWARGYELEDLRGVAGLFRQFDEEYRLGAFGGINERAVADHLAAAELLVDGPLGKPYAAAVVMRPKVRVQVEDFTGTARYQYQPGAVVVKRVACVPGHERALLQLVQFEGGTIAALEGWVEHPVVQALAADLGLTIRATKIRASSELVGVWGTGPGVPLSHEDLCGLTRLPLEPPTKMLAQALTEARLRVAEWADHYLSYNVGHAWSAVSLRGYHEPATEPEVWHESIVKPAEMSKGWKREHEGWEEWPLEDTPLYARLPACRALVNLLGGPVERVRLMRLTPGGGELTRHADIVDPTAGTAPGKYLRIHLPLLTNDRVLFESWRLDGRIVQANMAVGAAWYLDTRKPHRAGNYGDTERIHLVADVASNEHLLAQLRYGSEAELVEGAAVL